MRIALRSCLLGALLCTGLFAQAQNDASLSLIANGNGSGAPIDVAVVKPGILTLQTVTASPNVPYAMILGSGFLPATIDFGVIQIDCANPQILIDGISPMTFLDLLANTGGSSESSFSVPIGTQIPNGVVACFQIVALEPTAPFGVADSAAALVTAEDPCDFGTVVYGRGPTTTDHTSHFVSSSGAMATFGLPTASYDMESLNTNSWNYFIGNASAPGNIYRERFPLLQAYTNQESSSFEFIKTIYGDVYHFEDNVTGEFGFFVVPAPGAPPIEIPGSRVTNPGSTLTPWDIEVAISNDQSTMAVVYDPLTGNDQIYVMKLNGVSFPGGGFVADVTPATAPVTIPEDSITIVNDNVYFIDAAENGFLYRADLSAPPAPAQIVPLPLTGTGLPALTVNHEMHYHAASQQIFMQGGASTSVEDIFVISNIGAGSETIVNCSNFPTQTTIEIFGDAYDGVDGYMAVSPDGSRVCFTVLTTSTQEDLHWTLSDGTMTAVNLTPDAVMASANDTLIDLNFYSNTGILFFCGTGTTLMDLYHVDITAAPAYVNVTATSGSTSVPFASGGTMEPDGYFTTSDRMIFARDGTLTFGPSAGTTNAFNLVGVLYTGPNALTPFNVTGDEWPTTVPGSGTAANTGETGPTGFELVFAPSSDMVWFKSSIHPSTTAEDLWAYDATSTAPAFRFGMDASGSIIDNLRPDDSGFSCLFSYETTGDEEIHQAFFTVPGSTQLTDDPVSSTNDVADGTIRYFAQGAGCQGFTFARGTNSTTVPSDAQLFGIDFATGHQYLLDETIGNYWVFSVSYP